MRPALHTVAFGTTITINVTARTVQMYAMQATTNAHGSRPRPHVLTITNRIAIFMLIAHGKPTHA